MSLIDGRRRVSTFARLLLECHLRRRLVGDETADHIDGNYLNDAICNLQVLSLRDNAAKGASVDIKRRVAAETSARMRGVPRPDLRGELNGSAKLSTTQVRDILAKSTPYVRGTDKLLAAEYGVSRELISQIRRGVVRSQDA